MPSWVSLNCWQRHLFLKINTSFVTTIQRSGRSLLTLLNDVLDFSKIEAGELTLFESKFTIRELMDDAIEHVLPAAQEKGIELAAVVSPHVASTYIGDEGRLRQIFVNLLGNAVKFTESGSVVVAGKFGR